MTHGFKSGGYNTNQFQAPFDPEFIWAYELGLKASLLPWRTQFTIAGFYYDYKDLQLLTLPADAPPGTFPTITNAARPSVKGIDMAIATRPFPGFAADLNRLVLDAHFNDFVSVDPNNPGENPDRSGERMPQAPKFTVFLGAQYRWPLMRYGHLTARGEYR